MRDGQGRPTGMLIDVRTSVSSSIFMLLTPVNHITHPQEDGRDSGGTYSFLFVTFDIKMVKIQRVKEK